MFGFYRVATTVPRLRVADVPFNTGEIIALIKQGVESKASVLLFPELCITGYTCGDLFHQSYLLDKAEDALSEIVKASHGSNVVIIVGLPVRFDCRVFSAAVVIQNGEMKGIVPKSSLPNYREFYEKRHFSSGWNISATTVDLAGTNDIPFGTDLLFSVNRELCIGIEICEDLWSVIPPSCAQALAGATLIANPSASNELVGKADYRRALVAQQSARCVAAYAYTSSGFWESTTDTVYSGHCLVAENGTLMFNSPRFQTESSIYFTDVDLGRIVGTRYCESSFKDNAEKSNSAFRKIKLNPVDDLTDVKRTFPRHPFVPQEQFEKEESCDEIISIQTHGLAKRLLHTRSRSAVIGVSGGLDSTLALMVTVESMKLIGKSPSDVIAITMPGFGTTGRTYHNACQLAKALGTTLREISIKEACLEHFRAIGHEADNYNVVYENAQARERTQILMDVANQCDGLVIGTGDLSEIALGFCTYNADHMSMYAVNSGVPKTLVRHLVTHIANRSESPVREILNDIAQTPVSPELLSATDDGQIQQKTEEILAPYEIMDFFLYHFIKYGASPEKLLFLATMTFSDYPKTTLHAALQKFIRRFFSQQFKRSCMPDGPKVGSIALSPRADWRMPSDSAAWTLPDLE
ncbi:MAG: NAD(+) synthase [Victivallales bacterium]|nr:NAD(+) synthase [Victivallales bacterium]